MAYNTLSVRKTTYLSLIRPFFLSMIVRKHVLWQDGSPQPWIWHMIIYGVNVCLSVFSGLYPEHCSSEQSIDIERGKGDVNNLCLSLCMLYFLCFQMERCPGFLSSVLFFWSNWKSSYLKCEIQFLLQQRGQDHGDLWDIEDRHLVPILS